MPMPAEQTFAPLQIHRNPVSSTLQLIEEQAIYLARAQLDRQSDSDIRTELEWARDFASNGEPRFSHCVLLAPTPIRGTFLSMTTENPGLWIWKSQSTGPRPLISRMQL
jgi:hypothetical protein